MFGTRIANRTARGMAVGALILSLGVTTFGVSANAAPLADETQDCSAAAHARNDAVHLLHTAWKAFDGDLKVLAKDARELQHDSNKDKSSTTLTTDARAEVASAKQELKSIASKAHADIQAAVDLGSVCKDSQDESDTTTSTTTTATTITSTSTTAPSDATAPADSTEGARTFDTSGLDSKYKDIVDQAISDMQGVVDDARKAVLDMTAAAQAKETTTTDVAKVEQEVNKAKEDRATAKADRDEAKAAKDKSKDKSNGKSSNSGKGKGKGRD